MSEKTQSASIKEFVAEAEEILEGLNQNLLAMEAIPDRSVVKPEIINAIFRGAHTLKGMAGMVGLEQVSILSHSLEDLFDKVRMGRQKVSDGLVDVLFEGVEILRSLVELASKGKSNKIDTSVLIQKIQEISCGEKGQTSDQILEKAGVDPEILKVLTEYETHRLIDNIQRKIHLFEVVSVFKLESFDRELTLLNSKIQSLGEIITNLPNSDFANAEGIQFRLIVGSSHDYSSISKALEDAGVQIKEIQYGLEGPSEKGLKETTSHFSTGDQNEGDKEVQPEAGQTVSLKSLSQTIRVDINKLDGLLNVVGELVLTKAVIQQIAKDWVMERGLTGLAGELQKTVQILDRRVTDLQEGLVEVRMIPVGQVFDRLIRVVRKISKEIGKEIDLQISGEETKLDKLMIEEIADPLMHIIRNSIDHGIENREERRASGKPEIGKIRLNAIQKGNNVVIEVSDDGKGINREKVYQTALKKGLVVENKEYSDREILNFLFVPGFSTKEIVTEISGRGVGLDVAAKNIAKLSGIVDVESEFGIGTTFSITLPITLVIIQALIVKVEKEVFAIPLNSVLESLRISPLDIKTVKRKEVIYLRDRTLSLARLDVIFNLVQGEKNQENLYVIVVGIAEKKIGLVVDGIEGQQEIVIKTIGEFLKGVKGIAGATELGNRKTILVLDVGNLIEESSKGETQKIEQSTEK
ncbi:MAG TPA: chemotaxis protein CheA [Nitrospiria bacterium]|jgi:two-component system chemotaxis sensor kinase CheA